jgi:DUF4097 and DUF4098 domain-containing protein YvlB
MASWEFPAENPVSLRLRLTDGTIVVSARPTTVATVMLDGAQADATRVEYQQGTLSVNAPHRASLDAFIDLPEGSSCTVHTASADVRCTGDLGALDIHTASGDVSADRVTGAADIVTASGDVRVAEAAGIEVKTASGDITLGRATGPATVNTASGDVRIVQASGSRTEVTATSGDISVAVAAGIGVYLDLWTLSGTVRSELDPADEETGAADMALTCRSISGDVRVSRAAQPAQR